MARLSLRAPLPRRAELALGLFGLLGFLAAWHLTAVSGLVKPQFLPTPFAVLEALVRMFRDQGFAEDVVISIGRVWLAFALAVATAVPLGLAMTCFRSVGAIFEPFIDFIRYLPVPALVPLLIIWFGVGEASKIAVLWMGTFFQLVLLIADDAKRVPGEYLESGFTLGASRWQVIRDIIVPASLPNMVDNLRITLGWCWTYLIIAEIVAASSGVGHVIWSMRRFVKTPEVMAGIVAIGVVGLLTDQLFRFAHRRLFRYLKG